MPAMLRSIANRGIWASMVGLGLTATAVAQPPEDPIAASNKLTDLPVAPSAPPIDGEAPWMTRTPDPEPVPPTPSAKALLERLISRVRDPQPARVASEPHDPPPTCAATEPHGPPPARLATEAHEPLPAPIIQVHESQTAQLVGPVREPQTAPASNATWVAPERREPVPAKLPTSDRPMIQCEPAADPFHGPPTPTMPMTPLPPPRPMSPDDGELQTAAPQPTKIVTAPDDDPPPRTITTIRFVDETPAPAKPATDDPIIAIIRRGGSATGTAADIRAAVERICRNRVVECQTEIAGERQVRVLLKMRSEPDWQRLYERMQNLPELGEYGLLFEVRIEK